jgi:hypothetical protein
VKLFQIIILLISTLVFTTCKKKTTISVKVFNPALNEYVSGAVVSLLEIKDTKGFIGIGSKTECNEIATVTTDANGIATFDKEKLHKASKYKYKLAIKESWGIAHSDPCGSAREDYLDVGKTQEIQLSDYLEIEYKVEYNSSYLNPGISGDSLIADIAPMVYYDPMIGHTQGGGGGTTVNLTYDINYPITSTYYGPIRKIFANRLVVTTHKRKMGIATITVDTVRAYPSNGLTIIRLNW